MVPGSHAIPLRKTLSDILHRVVFDLGRPGFGGYRGPPCPLVARSDGSSGKLVTMTILRRRTIGVIMVASEEVALPDRQLELRAEPAPPSTTPAETRRFACCLADGSHAVLRLPVERYRDPARRVGAAIGGAIGFTAFWLVMALFMLFIPIIGMAIGGLMLLGVPLVPFIFAHQLRRDYVIACVSCTRRVRVSGLDHGGNGALCQCGARYRHAKLTEWPIEERNSNV